MPTSLLLMDPLLIVQLCHSLKLPLSCWHCTYKTHSTDAFLLSFKVGCDIMLLLHHSSHSSELCTPSLWNNGSPYFQNWVLVDTLDPMSYLSATVRKLCDSSAKTHAKHCHPLLIFDKLLLLSVSSLHGLRIHYKDVATVDWGLELWSLCKAWRDILGFILRGIWFIGRDLEWFSTITNITLCEAGVSKLNIGISIRLFRVLKVLLFAHIP